MEDVYNYVVVAEADVKALVMLVEDFNEAVAPLAVLQMHELLC